MHQGLGQFRLPVAINAGNPHNLASIDRQGDTVYFGVAGIISHMEILNLQHPLAMVGCGFLPLAADLTSHHQARQGARRRLLGCHRGNRLAIAHHGHPVGNLHHFMELMGDKNNGTPFTGQGA